MIEIYSLDRTLKKVDVKDIRKAKNKRLWIDVTGITNDEASLLQEVFDLHPLTTEDMVNQNIRIKVEEFNKYLFCIFYGVVKKKRVELVELDFVIGDTFVISNHREPVDSFDDLKKNKERLAELLGKGPDFMLHRLLDMEVDNYFPILEAIDDEIETIEESVTKKATPKMLDDILRLKRRITRIKKYVLPQREKTSFLAKNGYRFISKRSLPYFRDIYDHAVRVADSVDNYREAIGNTFDIYMSSVSNNMNEVMKVLSIIATIALPLTVISGIYGTNFTTLPGSTFAYGFWAMVLAMVLLCVVMISFFKRRGWF